MTRPQNRIHPTAIVDEGVEIGDGTSIWDNAQVRRTAVIGDDCIVGGKAYIAGTVSIGNRVKINSFAYICAGVTLGDGVMISAHVTFTNDRYPRATTPDLKELRSSDVDEHTLYTTVKEGTTIGAAAVIGPGLTLGRFSMVGMGSVVTRDVDDFHLVVGTPAAPIAAVCRCGNPLARFDGGDEPEVRDVQCSECGLRYSIVGKRVRESDD